MRSNIAGFSLMEVSIASGLFSLVILIFMGGYSMAMDNARTLRDNERVANAMLRLATAFGDDDRYCTSILGGINIIGSPTQGTPVPAIDYYDLEGNKLAGLFKIGEPIAPGEQVDVKDMRLRRTNDLGDGYFLTSLDISFVRSSGVGIPVKRRIPIFAVVDGSGNLVRCSPYSLSTMSVRERSCKMEFDGFGEYDPVTNGCKDGATVAWVISANPLLATCPVGQKIASSGLDPVLAAEVNCLADRADTMMVRQRGYRSGRIARDPVRDWLATVDFMTNSCKFIYKGTAPASGTTKIRCRGP